MRFITAILAIAVLIGSGAESRAQVVSAEEIIRALMEPERESGESRGVVRTKMEAMVTDRPRVDLSVAFEPNSHILTVNGLTLLRSLASALMDDRLATARVQISGHAISPRSPADSQPLSARRASAVVNHLIAFYGIRPERLTAVGLGQSAPRDLSNLGSPLNQRIEVINLGPLG